MSDLAEWFLAAKPGDCTVYYRGDLACARAYGVQGLEHAALAYSLAESGAAFVYQQRLGGGAFNYIIRKATPRAKPAHGLY